MLRRRMKNFECRKIVQNRTDIPAEISLMSDQDDKIPRYMKLPDQMIDLTFTRAGTGAIFL